MFLFLVLSGDCRLGSGLSTELVAAVRNLQAQLTATAEARLNTAQAEFDEKLQSMEDRLRSLIEACGHAKAERDGLAIQLKAEKNTLERALSTIQALEIGQATTKTENTGLHSRLHDKDAELARGALQLKQAETQFEHFQTSVTVQRTDERKSFEHARQLLEHELARLRQEEMQRELLIAQQRHEIERREGVDSKLQETRDEYSRLQDEFTKLTQNLVTQTALTADLHSRFNSSEDQLSEANDELAVFRAERPQMQARILALEEKVVSLAGQLQKQLIETARLESQALTHLPKSK